VTRVLTVVGARPQFIKAAPLSVALRRRGIEEVLVHTGQHYDQAMSARFFAELDLPPPAVNLGVGSASQAAQTGAMLAALEPVMVEARPDWVVVFGDTNSTLAGALAAAKLNLPVAHVEAGLRSYNRRMPEEINRIVADSVATLLFAPTAAAAAILKGEGHPDERIVVCGDVMYDACLAFAARARTASDVLDRLALAEGGFVLSTIHRAETTGDPRRLAAVLGGLGAIGERLPVILPLHPRTAGALAEHRVPTPPGVRLIDPVGYLDMARLTMAARLVATDSGGLQKEAFFHRVPCVTLRTETEWSELVRSGWNRLAPPDDPDAIAETIIAALAAPLPGDAPPYYGKGDAAGIIAGRLVG
jgi:UDP-GlcNAc3NAcA epimerase